MHGKSLESDFSSILASSGLLQKQIEEGAPVDLFISAGKSQMDELAAKGMLIPQTRSDLLGGELVLIVAREKQALIKGFADLSKGAFSFSIGQPETVPVGKYAKETLQSMKLWDKLANRIVFAKDTRQVLTYVDSGNVDAGLVYRSDAVALQGAVVAAVAPKTFPFADCLSDGGNYSGKESRSDQKVYEFSQVA